MTSLVESGSVGMFRSTDASPQQDTGSRSASRVGDLTPKELNLNLCSLTASPVQSHCCLLPQTTNAFSNAFDIIPAHRSVSPVVVNVFICTSHTSSIIGTVLPSRCHIVYWSTTLERIRLVRRQRISGVLLWFLLFVRMPCIAARYLLPWWWGQTGRTNCCC